MQVRILSLVIVTTLTANSAYALTPAQISSARATYDLKEVWLSGSSSATRSVFETFKKDCIDTIDMYTSDASGTVPGSAGDFLAYACTTATLGKTVVYHTVAGGSFNAFSPHVVGAQLRRIKRPDDNAACVVNDGNARVYNLCDIINPVATPDAAVNKPDGGFSDVESELFQDLFTTDPLSVGNEVAVSVGQVFGVVVSTNLYRAMQTAQGLNTATCTDDVYLAASNKTYIQNGSHDFRDPSCMPNISKAQYTSIVAAGGGYQTDWQPLLGAAGAGKAVNLCSRAPTSGTQAASNAYFLGSPCNRGPLTGGELLRVLSGDSSAASATASSGIFITESSGTFDVKRCLNNANDSPAQYTNSPTQYFAIGVMSAENDPFKEDLPTRDDYRFIKLDGVSPENALDDRARQNAINGDYGFAAEMVAFTANSASVNGTAMISTISERIGAYTVYKPTYSFGVFSDLRGLFVSPAGGWDHTIFPTQVHKGAKFGENCKPWNLFW